MLPLTSYGTCHCDFLRRYIWQSCNDSVMLLTAKFINADIRKTFRAWLMISVVVTFTTMAVNGLAVISIAFSRKRRRRLPSLVVILVMCLGHVILASSRFYRNMLEVVRITNSRSSVMSGVQCFYEFLPYSAAMQLLLTCNLLQCADRLIFSRFPVWYKTHVSTVAYATTGALAALYTAVILVVQRLYTSPCLAFACSTELTTERTFAMFSRVEQYVRISAASVLSVAILVAVKVNREQRQRTDDATDWEVVDSNDQTMVAIAVSVLGGNVLFVSSRVLFHMSQLFATDGNQSTTVDTVLANMTVVGNFTGLLTFLVFVVKVDSFRQCVSAFLTRILSICHLVQTVATNTSDNNNVRNKDATVHVIRS